jgi:hypothetical protein
MTAEHARRRAERAAARSGGAIAVEMIVDENTGAGDSLESFGNVPDDLDAL